MPDQGCQNSNFEKFGHFRSALAMKSTFALYMKFGYFSAIFQFVTAKRSFH